MIVTFICQYVIGGSYFNIIDVETNLSIIVRAGEGIITNGDALARELAKYEDSGKGEARTHGDVRD